MACFAVPSALGMFTMVFRGHVPKQWHINWLNTMIWGGAIALAVEHYIHGEIVPWPPFFTAMANPADMTIMFREMAIVGIPMTLALVAVWVVLAITYNKIFSVRNSPVIAVLSSYRLDLLGLMLLGTLVMMFIDQNIILLGTALGFAILAPLFIIWAVAASKNAFQPL